MTADEALDRIMLMECADLLFAEEAAAIRAELASLRRRAEHAEGELDRRHVRLPTREGEPVEWAVRNEQPMRPDLAAERQRAGVMREYAAKSRILCAAADRRGDYETAIVLDNCNRLLDRAADDLEARLLGEGRPDDWTWHPKSAAPAPGGEVLP
jgi:hypothetical protein